MKSCNPVYFFGREFVSASHLSLASFLACKYLKSARFSPLLFLVLLCSMSVIPCRKFHYG